MADAVNKHDSGLFSFSTMFVITLEQNILFFPMVKVHQELSIPPYATDIGSIFLPEKVSSELAKATSLSYASPRPSLQIPNSQKKKRGEKKIRGSNVHKIYQKKEAAVEKSIT